MKKYLKPLVIGTLLLILVHFSAAQVIYFPYYGKNRIVYKEFSWNHYRTNHFDIYYYDHNIKTLKRIADLAESAYARISQELKHQLSEVVPLLYYGTYTEFEQNNLVRVSEGVLGLAEPILYRFLVRGDIADDELQDLINHELTHIFQYDILYGGPGMALYAISQPPGWAMEGFADYNTGRWSSWSSLIVRDAVVNDRIPELTERGQLFSRYPLPRPPDYDFGHAIFEFIEQRYGKTTIREFWHSMKNSSLTRKPNPVKKVFNETPKEFSHSFKKYLRKKYHKFLMRQNPEDYSLTLGPEFPINQYYFTFSHSVSPSGDLIAALTYNVKDSDIDIVLISAKSGKVLKNITRGYTLKYESIKYEIDASKGKDISWSQDGDRIAFFGRTGKDYSLFLVNPITGKTEKKIEIPIGQPSGVQFLPDGNEILLTGFKDGNHDIFKLNLSTEKIINLTNDDLFEKAPAVSPDGQFVAYTIRVDVFDKLFLSPINNLKKRTQLTFGRGNTITPAFSPDSKMIFFSGDMRESFNVYSANLETGNLKRYTDVRTGNFFPTPLPNAPDHIVFASFNKGAFQIFSSKLEGTDEKTIRFEDIKPEEKLQKFEPLVKINIQKEKIKPLKGMGKLYLMARPPVDTIVSTDGSLWGGTALTFSDLMGDNVFNLTAYQVRNFRSYYFSYLNQKKRLQYMAQAYSYSIFYYAPYAYTNPLLYEYLNYRDAIAVRRIAGANMTAFYPLNKFYRIEASFSLAKYEEDFYDPYYAQQLAAGGNFFSGFVNGNAMSASAAITGETTRFKAFGPLTGNTFRLSFAQTIPVANSFIRNTTVDADLRQYFYIGMDSLFAVRFHGFMSRGRNPYIFYWGGNNQVRSSYYYNIIGNEGWYANLEFRFPLINSASTIIGQIGPVRGAFFFDISRAKIKGYAAQFYRLIDPLSMQTDIYDAIGSYGFGFQFFFLGFPIHLEFVKALEFPKMSNPWDFNVIGNWQTKFWIGYDF